MIDFLIYWALFLLMFWMGWFAGKISYREGLRDYAKREGTTRGIFTRQVMNDYDKGK